MDVRRANKIPKRQIQSGVSVIMRLALDNKPSVVRDNQSSLKKPLLVRSVFGRHYCQWVIILTSTGCLRGSSDKKESVSLILIQYLTLFAKPERTAFKI